MTVAIDTVRALARCTGFRGYNLDALRADGHSVNAEYVARREPDRYLIGGGRPCGFDGWVDLPRGPYGTSLTRACPSCHSDLASRGSLKVQPPRGGKCNSVCRASRSKVCRCPCGGKNHGCDEMGDLIAESDVAMIGRSASRSERAVSGFASGVPS